jgi:hypothetical protein
MITDLQKERGSYCVYATNSLEVDLTLEYRLAFFLELL